MSDAPLPLDEFETAAAWYRQVLWNVGDAADEIYGRPNGVESHTLAAQFVQSLARRGYTIEKMTDG